MTVKERKPSSSSATRRHACPSAAATRSDAEVIKPARRQLRADLSGRMTFPRWSGLGVPGGTLGCPKSVSGFPTAIQVLETSAMKPAT
jgi:hypothetical protein